METLAHVPPKQRPAVRRHAQVAQENAKAAHKHWAIVAESPRERFPRRAELMDSAREDVGA
jgi:hypothetical protein